MSATSRSTAWRRYALPARLPHGRLAPHEDDAPAAARRIALLAALALALALVDGAFAGIVLFVAGLAALAAYAASHPHRP